MSISEKIKAINNKVEQNKAQCNLDRQAAKISALSSGNVSKYQFLTGKDVLPDKAAALKRFEYLPLGKELKAQTNVAEKQYQKLNKIFESDNKEEEPVTIKKEEPVAIKKEIIHELKLIYNNKYSFSEHRNVGKYMDDSLFSQDVIDWLSFIID